MNRTKSVLVLAKAYPPVAGGVETYSEQVARAYLDSGYAVTVITQIGGKRGWSERRYPEGIARIFDGGPGNQAAMAAQFAIEVRRELARRAYAFVHATTWRPAAVLIGAVHSTPLVVTTHGREILKVPRWAAGGMKSILKNASAVIAVSSATLEKTASRLGATVPRGRWAVAWNGLTYPELAVSARERSAGDTLRILTLARLVERKNIHGSLKALADLRASGLEDFEYVIAGTGPELARLQTASRSLGLDAHVRFLGYVPDESIAELYLEADIFLHPQVATDDGADFEGFGIVIADAMSFGCAVVAGSDGGPRDFVKDGVTGVLVDGENAAELRDALGTLARDGMRRAVIAERGRAFVIENLSWRRHVQTILEAVDAREAA